MQYRALDADRDYTLGKMLSGREAVGQAILTRLLLLRGEWWEDEEDGLPLFEEILGSFRGENDLGGIDLLLSERILTTEGVSRIGQFDSSFDEARRAYTASILVETTYGAVTVQFGGGTVRVEF